VNREVAKGALEQFDALGLLNHCFQRNEILRFSKMALCPLLAIRPWFHEGGKEGWGVLGFDIYLFFIF
jgi:hypothetical protein